MKGIRCENEETLELRDGRLEVGIFANIERSYSFL